VNPLKKVPAFMTDNGTIITESFVIMEYLEDKYGNKGPNMRLKSPEDRAFVNGIVRSHDLYISSPNCTQPGFCHTQGSMYLSPCETAFTSKDRALATGRRASKIAEIF
jgi:glutaredoxin 2